MISMKTIERLKWEELKMDDLTNNIEVPEQSKISNRKKLLVGVIGVFGSIMLCCCGVIAFGAYYNNTPEGQADATVRAEVAQATREERTAVAIIAATEEARPTDTPIPTNTPIPTDTPEPTTIPDPTDTPKPTSIPDPTNTPLPEPTNTLTPTETPTEQQSPSGMGLSRSDFTTLFSQPELGFTFEESSEVDGQPRIMGTSEFETVFMELIGPTDDLTQVSVMVGVSDDENEFARNLVYMVGFLSVAIPDWPEGSDWLIENIDVVVSEGEATTTVNNKTVTFEFFSELGLLLLMIEAE